MAVLTDSNFGKLLTEARQQIEDLDLAGIGANVVIKKLPWENKPTAAKCVVSPAPEFLLPTESPGGVADVRYRILLSIFQPANRDLVDKLADELLWRERVRQHFHYTDSLSQSGVLICSTTVEPGEPIMPAQFRLMVDAQFMLLNVRVRENLK